MQPDTHAHAPADIRAILEKRNKFGPTVGLEDGLTRDERLQLARYKQKETLRKILHSEKTQKTLTE
eukprot:7310728-Prymnesium_polylepis.2